MKTVELLTSRVGISWVQNEGDIVELSDDEAIALVKSNQARFVETATVETGMIDNRKLETAVSHRGRKRYGS